MPNDNDNFKLIHSSGTTKTDEPTQDERFSVSINDSMKVKRLVEMYQWIEEQQDNGEGEETTYNYTQEWSSSHINSSDYNS